MRCSKPWAFGVTTAVVMWAAPSQFVSRVKDLETADRPDIAGILSAGTGATAPGGHPTQMGGPPAPTLAAPGEADAFVAARMAEGFVSPTLSVLYATCGTPDGPGFLKDADTMKQVKPQFRSQLEVPSEPSTVRCDAAPQAIRQLMAARVPLLAGTDAPASGTTYGASLHKELEHLVDAGMTPAAALAAATSATAKAFRMLDRGRISTGMRADLLLVDGDPSKQIHDTRNIVAVWKRGIRVTR